MAAGERKPGSNSGRAKISWAEAFLFFASLPAEQRTYQAVADAYPSVSLRTVERHGRDEDWKDRAKRLDLEAAQVAAAQLRDERAEKLLDFDRLIDATKVTYANQLRDGKVRVSPSDLVRMYKLGVELWAASDDATLISSATAPSASSAAIDPVEHRLQVVRALRDAGALADLLGLDPDHGGDESPHPGESHSEQSDAEPAKDEDDE